MKIRKVVIPAAGIGSRFLPASKAVAKELLPVVDQSILQYGLEEARQAGVTEIILVTSPRKKDLSHYFEPDEALEEALAQQGKEDLLARLRAVREGFKVTTVVQEEPKGLGHAIAITKEAVGEEPFAVILPDDLIRASTPVLAQMISLWEERKQGCIAVRTVAKERVNQYGIVVTASSEGKVHVIQDLVEKPAVEETPSQLAVIGRYLLPPSIFDSLRELSAGALGEIQLTDALRHLASQEGLLAYEFEGEHYDAGQPLGWMLANISYGLTNPQWGGSLRRALQEIL